MAGYIRQDTTNNIATGSVINAGDFDLEFDAIVGAFSNSAGHKHDGTTAEGNPITVIGPAQDIVVNSSSILPKTTATYDLGSTVKTFKTAYIDTLNVTTATITGGTITGITDLAVADGGTGISSYTVGDLVYASGATTLAKLADVATGNVVLSGGVGIIPAYGKVGLTTHVSGVLPVANGGTGVSTSTGTGNTVFSASPTFTGIMTTDDIVINNGYLTVDFDVMVYGNVYTDHSTSYTKTAAATLTYSETYGGHLVYTGTAATLTLPTGTTLHTNFTSTTFAADSASNGFCFELSIINTGTGTVTIGSASGLTLIGAMTIPINTSGTLRFQKTNTNTFTVLRIA